jgi:hypothetical protein
LRWGLAAGRGSGDGRDGLVAEVFEQVTAAFEELALERETGAVAADAGGELFVIRAVGAALSAKVR